MIERTSELLSAARELIADEARWTRDWSAKRGDGMPVEPESPEATCWCALGAVRRAVHDQPDRGAAAVGEPHPLEPLAYAAERRLEGAIDILGFCPSTPPNPVSRVPSVNDFLGHAAVMSMYDVAIEQAKNAEAFEAQEVGA